LNGYEEPFDGFIAPFVDEGNDPNGSTKMTSAWGLPKIGVPEGVPSIQGIGSMGCNTIEDGSKRYLIANL
jgi:hypothetical protein